VSKPKLSKSDAELAVRIRKLIIAEFNGDHIAQDLVRAARACGLSIPLALGLVEVESAFKNVFGHDNVRNPVKSPQGGLLRVTDARLNEYRSHRARGEGNQGVGYTQLTARDFQDEADRLGGMGLPYANMYVGFKLLESYIKHYGLRDRAIAAFNTGPGNRWSSQGARYQYNVIAAANRWAHKLGLNKVA
jgi:hypothetical protein